MGTAILKTTATCIIQRNARPKERYRNETHLQKKNDRWLQISLPVHIQNACSTFRIRVSEAITLGLATKRKEKKMLMESHKFHRTF
jgi:hypothetical protein